MKNKDLKKGRESIIGKIIYGFLLFMPLIAIFSTILINTFNMAEKEEAEITYKYETNEVTSQNDIKQGNLYKFDFGNLPSVQATTPILNITGYISKSSNSDITITQTNGTVVLSELNNGQPYININNNGTLYTNAGTTIYVVLDSVISQNVNYTYFHKADIEIPIESVETHNLEAEDIFYNAIDKVEQSSLFNWAINSLIYTGIENTCTQLSITTPFIPLLLAYWLIISVIYILYDIILMILIILHNKIHQIQETI